ncbi:hypothetical protein DYB31_003714 [Aphanomyces astaci]|uniref:EGF-like domain-containing protein n=1 Tax=Aphanomyces astaci TaxID=112090 RepID=A0A397EYU0_APHAT|nr:hypothetical protein DYB31_003714 [Aphanomyces astaci]
MPRACLASAMMCAFVKAQKTTIDLDGCKACAKHNNCEFAVNNERPGVFCGVFTRPEQVLQQPGNQSACCCPLDVPCDVGLFTCSCLPASSWNPFPTTADTLLAITFAAVVLLVLCVFSTTLCCVYCVYRCCCHPTDSVAISIDDDSLFQLQTVAAEGDEEGDDGVTTADPAPQSNN